MSLPLVSIIIPVFNRERTISNCLNSIINQTYKNLEIIVVDSNSNDDTKSIVDVLIKKDKRIKYINSPHKGAMSQRSFGILSSSGEYVQCVDSDDTVHKDFTQILVNNIIKYNSDLSTCEYSKSAILLLSNETKSFDGDQYKKMLDDIKYNFRHFSCVTKLVKSEIAKKVCLSFYNSSNQTTLWEDTIYSFGVFLLSKSIVMTTAQLYVYNDNPESVTHRQINYLDRMLNSINVKNVLHEEINSFNTAIAKEQTSLFLLIECINYLKIECLKSYKSGKIAFNKIRSLFSKKEKAYFKKSQSISKTYKCLLSLFKKHLYSITYVFVHIFLTKKQ